MSNKLSLAEQETIILWDNELNTASIYTHDPRLLRRLTELSEKYPDDCIFEKNGAGKSRFYRVPKKLIAIRNPYSEERRKSSGSRRCWKTTGNGFPEIPGMLPERKYNLRMTRNETGGRAAGTQTGGGLAMDSNRKSDERTVRSAAEQIRGRLEQFPEEEFILQIPLNAAPEREVKNHE